MTSKFDPVKCPGCGGAIWEIAVLQEHLETFDSATMNKSEYDGPGTMWTQAHKVSCVSSGECDLVFTSEHPHHDPSGRNILKEVRDALPHDGPVPTLRS